MPQPRKRRRATSAGDRARKRQQNQQQRVPQPASSHEQRNLALLDSLLFTSDNRLHAIVSAASLAVILSSGSHTCKPRHQMVRKQTDSLPVWVQGVCADQHLLHH